MGADTRVLLVPRLDGAYARVGLVAEVSERVRLAGRGFAVSLMPLHRADPGRRPRLADAGCSASMSTRARTTAPPADATRELEREYRAVVDEILELRGDDGRIRAFVRSITEPGALADTAGYSPDVNAGQKRQLLETLDVVERLTARAPIAARAARRAAGAQAHPRRVEDEPQKQQREYFLRRQMEAIRKELGEQRRSAGGRISPEDRRRRHAGPAVQQQAERELARLERMGDSNAESAMIRTYLDWLLAVPWAKRSDERLDPVHAREVLDADHEGLDDVKRRITEYLAVRKLRSDRGMADTAAQG